MHGDVLAISHLDTVYKWSRSVMESQVPSYGRRGDDGEKTSGIGRSWGPTGPCAGTPYILCVKLCFGLTAITLTPRATSCEGGSASAVP